MNYQDGTKVMIPVTSCIPGMTLMQSIVDENTGTTIVGKGQVLTVEILEKLKNFQHTQVWISLESDEESHAPTKGEHSVWRLDTQVVQNYKLYAQILKSVVEDGKQGEQLSLDKLVNIADRMIEEFKDNYSLLGCVHLLDQLGRDEYLHSINVASISLVLGKWIGYEEALLKDIIITALLHDVGMLDINPIVLHKSEEEMSYMEKLEYRRHPILGYERLAAYKELDVELVLELEKIFYLYFISNLEIL